VAVLTLVLLVTAAADAAVAAKPRVVVIVPFDAAAAGPDWGWVGQGIAEALSLGLAQHSAVIQVDPAQLKAFGQPEAWGESAVLQAARGLRVDAALFGTLTRTGGDLALDPPAARWWRSSLFRCPRATWSHGCLSSFWPMRER
jgi:TolB-like protein